ncbi:hypothetical protein ACFL1H_02210 [Nanoarchaeota archaeon]
MKKIICIFIGLLVCSMLIGCSSTPQIDCGEAEVMGSWQDDPATICIMTYLKVCGKAKYVSNVGDSFIIHGEQNGYCKIDFRSSKCSIPIELVKNIDNDFDIEPYCKLVNQY